MHTLQHKADLPTSSATLALARCSGLLSAADVLSDKQTREMANRLAAVILLAGAVGIRTFPRTVGRCMIELPVDISRRLLDVWRDQVFSLTNHLGLARLPVRVLIDHLTPNSHHPPPFGSSAGKGDSEVPMSIERDPVALRGTGGLLRDVLTDYHKDDYVLVADAGQLLLDPLWAVFQRLARSPGDVRLLARGDHAPAGLSLVRCGSLSHLPPVGFIDFKEQALPRIADRHDVRVVPWAGEGGFPLTTLTSYLRAVRQWHKRTEQTHERLFPSVEEGHRAFALIEPGAEVHRSAIVHDAVVLAGGCVEAHATVVHSVVGSGGVAQSGRTHLNTIVATHRPV